MLLYLLKSGICLTLLYLFYRLFLEHENMHLFKRWYLLLSLLLAFGIPLITFTYTVPAVPGRQLIEETPLALNTGQAREPYYSLTTVLWSLYGLGAFVFGFLFIKNLSRMLSKIKQNIKVKTRYCTRVLVRESVIPHTFFSYIFLNKHTFEAQQIPKEVLLHEEAHARQKHSLDILFMEALQVLFWFNPLIYMLKRAIKLNHEFLADRSVINQGAAPSTYQHMLLAFSSSAKQHQLANAINYSLIKKRFTVMTKQTSKKAVRLRSLLLLPLLVVLLYSFSNKVAVAEKNTVVEPPENKVQTAPPQQTQNNDEYIEIFISSKGHILINNRKTTMSGLESKIRKISNTLSSGERKRLTASIYTESSVDMKMMESIVKLLRDHGISRITFSGNMPASEVEKAEIIAYEKHARAAARDRKRAVLVERLEEREAKEAAEMEAEKAILVERLAEIEAERAEEAEAVIEIRAEKAALAAELARIEVEEVAEAEEVIEVEVEKAALAAELAEIEAERAEEAEDVIEIRAEKAALAAELARIEAIKVAEAEDRRRAIEVIEIPPPPPPVSPEKHVMKMAEKGAVFYYNGKKISSDKAVRLVKSKKNINVLIKRSSSKQPVVHLSSKPIVIEE